MKGQHLLSKNLSMIVCQTIQYKELWWKVKMQTQFTSSNIHHPRLTTTRSNDIMHRCYSSFFLLLYSTPKPKYLEIKANIFPSFPQDSSQEDVFFSWLAFFLYKGKRRKICFLKSCIIHDHYNEPNQISGVFLQHAEHMHKQPWKHRLDHKCLLTISFVITREIRLYRTNYFQINELCRLPVFAH